MSLEDVYTIPLGKVLLSPDNRRAKRAINMIREFARHHMKIEDIRIEEEVAHQIWARGIRRPPRKIKVRMEKTEEGFVLISKYDAQMKAPEDAAKTANDDVPAKAGEGAEAKTDAPILEGVEPAEKPEAKTIEPEKAGDAQPAEHDQKAASASTDKQDAEPKEAKGASKSEK